MRMSVACRRLDGGNTLIESNPYHSANRTDLSLQVGFSFVLRCRSAMEEKTIAFSDCKCYYIL